MVDRPYDTVLRFPYSDKRRASLVADAVRVEAASVAAVDDRSRTGVEQDDETVVVRIVAADLVALRAACATWTRLVGVAERFADSM